MDKKFDDGVEKRWKAWHGGQVEPDHKIQKLLGQFWEN